MNKAPQQLAAWSCQRPTPDSGHLKKRRPDRGEIRTVAETPLVVTAHATKDRRLYSHISKGRADLQYTHRGPYNTLRWL